MMSPDADVLVIGAGPAGASVAIRLARAGWRVVLIEQSTYPRHKVCGECLGSAALHLLDELGVGSRLEELAGPEIRHVGWMTGTRTIIAAMPPCAFALHRYGRAIGRDRLDGLLLERAVAAGVHLIQPAKVRAVRGAPGHFVCQYHRRSDTDRNAPRAAEESISASIVIDAHGSWERGPETDADARDGNRRLHDDRCTSPRPFDLLAFKASFQGSALPPGLLPVIALPGGYGGMVIADRGRTTVACCVRRDTLRACRAPAAFESAGAAVEAYLRRSCPGVAAVLDGARREGAWQSVGPLRLGLHTAASSGVLRAGNAAVEAHPLIGEGICMALQSAAMLAERLGAPPARIDERFIRRTQDHYTRACHAAFARRLRLARVYAYVAVHRPLAESAAAVMQGCPRALTRAAQLVGKSLAASLRVEGSPDTSRAAGRPFSLRERRGR